MRTWRFILTGLLMVGSISAQMPPASLLTKDQIEAIKAKNDAVVELNGLITQTNAVAQAKDWLKTKDLAEKLIAANAKLATAYPDDAGYQTLLSDIHIAFSNSPPTKQPFHFLPDPNCSYLRGSGWLG
jgi:hypothetical protein